MQTSKLETGKICITKLMLDKLDYDEMTGNKKITTSQDKSPSAMFVFNQSDLDAASYYVSNCLQNPLHEGAIKCIFVQESCVEKFSAKLKSLLKPYSKEQLSDTTLLNALSRSSEIISKLKAKTIQPDSKDYGPIIVYDFPQEHFCCDGPSPVVTLYTFRTAKEAIVLSKKESLIKNATIWCENHAMAYEVIVQSSFKNHYLNCYNVSWDPLEQYIEKKQSFALVKNFYHYETVEISGIQKNIVFPFGTSFAN